MLQPLQQQIITKIINPECLQEFPVQFPNQNGPWLQTFWVLSGIFCGQENAHREKTKDIFLLLSGCNSSPVAENIRKVKMLSQTLES